MPEIIYHSSEFGQHRSDSFQGTNTFASSWSEILWSAITVGKRDRSALIRNGQHSFFEWIYRISIVWANLRVGDDGRLYRSSAYNRLDPSEKSAVSYFLGLTASKLLASRFLNTPWLMHLDVYRDYLNPETASSRSRPDLVGLNQSRDWIVVEAKGRSNELGDAISAAKQQTKQLRKINGRLPYLRVGCACHFVENAFHISWQDPEEYHENATDYDIDISKYVEIYYHPFVDLLKNETVERVDGAKFKSRYFEDSDITIGIYEPVVEWCESSDSGKEWDISPPSTGFEYPSERIAIGADGILVRAGERWSKQNLRRQPK